MRIAGAILISLASSLPAWAEGAVGRLCWASHQIQFTDQGAGASPLRGILFAMLLAVALVSACRWVRRTHPVRRDDVPHR